MLLVRAANTTPSINIASCHSTDSTVLPALPRRARVNGGVFAAPRLPGDATGIEREERDKKEEITETEKKPRKKKKNGLATPPSAVCLPRVGVLQNLIPCSKRQSKN